MYHYWLPTDSTDLYLTIRYQNVLAWDRQYAFAIKLTIMNDERNNFIQRKETLSNNKLILPTYKGKEIKQHKPKSTEIVQSLQQETRNHIFVKGEMLKDESTPLSEESIS